MESSPIALAWAAGFFDGEGCITICKRGIAPGTHTIRLQVAQVVRQPIDKFVELFGGRVYCYSANTPAGRRPYFTWIVEARKAEAVLSSLFPHLIGKRREAELALEFMAWMPKWGNRHHRPTEADLAKREQYRLALIGMHGLQGKNQPQVSITPEQHEADMERARVYARQYYANNREQLTERAKQRASRAKQTESVSTVDMW